MALHRVARIDRQIEERILDLGRIDERIPQAARDHRFRFRCLHQARGAAYRRSPRIRRPRLTTFGARGCRRPKARSCEASFDPARDRWQCSLQPLFGPQIPATSLRQKLQIAADDLQDVVEIVRHAAGEFSHSLHFLRLAEVGPRLQSARRSLPRPVARGVRSSAGGFVRPLARRDVGEQRQTAPTTAPVDAAQTASPGSRSSSSAHVAINAARALDPDSFLGRRCRIGRSCCGTSTHRRHEAVPCAADCFLRRWPVRVRTKAGKRRVRPPGPMRQPRRSLVNHTAAAHISGTRFTFRRQVPGGFTSNTRQVADWHSRGRSTLALRRA